MDTALVIHAERHGKFVANQMLRPFGDSSLLGMALQKLAHVDVPCNRYVATADPEIRRMARRYPEFKVIRMTDEASMGETLSDAYDHLRPLHEDWFLDINPSYPLVSAEVWWDAIEQFLSTRQPGLVSAHHLDGTLFDADGVPVDPTGAKQVLNGAFRLISKEAIFNEGTYWNAADGQPHAYHLPRTEAWGISDAQDLPAVEAIWSMSRLALLV